MPTGRLKSFCYNRGFGFIQQDNGNEDVFVQIRAVERASLYDLAEGDAVDFDIVADPKKRGELGRSTFGSSALTHLDFNIDHTAGGGQGPSC